MKIKFNNLDYQNDAIKSSVDILKGQSFKNSQFTIELNDNFQGSAFSDDGLGIANDKNISDNKMLDNVRDVQKNNMITQSESLYGSNNKFPQFNIEMETGTGKTYVYLKTILELNKKYGLKKFVIIVPSVAIKEGVIKTFEMTKSDFSHSFQNLIYNLFSYDGNNLDRVQRFASSNNIEIMVITMGAFNKDFESLKDNKGNTNIIYRENDQLAGQRPIDLIANTKPILIIDEPQAVDNTDKSKNAINNLNPLIGFRYSATHKDKSYPTIYKLNAVDAYNKKLVKQIEVSSIESDENGNKAYMRLKSVSNKNRKIFAKIETYVKKKSKIKKETKNFKLSENVYKKVHLPIYKSVGDIQEIDTTPGKEKVIFSGISEPLTLSTSNQEDLDEKRIQLRTLIETHLNKELYLNKMGIKVLSLVFLDKVSNYRLYNKDGSSSKGRYAQIFEEEYMKIIKKDKYKNLNDIDVPANKVHEGYFSRDNKNRMKDSYGKNGNSKADESTYNLIMKDKEQLLTMYDSKNKSKANKIRFIFSHSALKEGWDNPNVFQIATLVDTKDTITKRQKIGRGLRIAVNQNGERVPGFNVNTLTVIANEDYSSFAKGLQKEYEDDGFKFGVFTEDTFSTIIDENNDTLGIDRSKKIINEFKNNKYIDNNLHATNILKNDLNNDEIKLSDSFRQYNDEIINISKSKIDNIPVKNAKNKFKISQNKEINSKAFMNLWKKIKHKTFYKVEFSVEKLVNESVESINHMLIEDIKYKDIKASLNIEDSGIEAKETNIKYYEKIDNNYYQLPDIITYLKDNTNLTRKTITRILTRVNNLNKFKTNPTSYMMKAADSINSVKSRLMIDGIEYKQNGEVYDQKLFADKNLYSYVGDVRNFEVDTNKKKTLYNYIVTDSKIERDFAKQLELDDNIEFYIKMPYWFKVPTPLGDYNPDWAIIRKELNDDKKLYFIADTKGNTNNDQLRQHEISKLHAGKSSFKSLDTGIIFRKLTNESELYDE